MTLNRRIKGLLGQAVGVGRLKRALAGRAAILCLHSVTADRCPDTDPVRVPVDHFRVLCRLLRRYFSVISLTELVGKLEAGEKLNGEVVISFDDGYKDNRELAAAVLVEFALPATFFVTVNFIGSSFVPFWEAAQNRIPQWMDWRDVRDLSASGFEIGAHSMNHADLAGCDGEGLVKEITQCKLELEQHLSVPIEHFAFPFGGKNNYSEEAISVVQRSGYRSSVTCHGGMVNKGDRLFTLGRLPYSAWYLSPYQFLFDQAREYPQ